jgi:UDP-glucose 4-epimerase
MKALVTGGAGFIGSHLVDRLIELGHEVVVIDNETSTSSNGVFYWNSNAENYKADICDFGSTRSLYDGVDYVFHMAADTSIYESINNPIKTMFINGFGTSVVLQSAREARVKRVILSSSYSVYGNNKLPNKEEQQEDYLNPYGLSKGNAENFCKFYSKTFKTDTIILRYFNVYGERQPVSGQYSPIMERFNNEKKSNKPLTIIGSGEERKDFTHVSDIVEANIIAAEINLDDKYIGDVFNIGFGKNYSTNEIANMYNHKILDKPVTTINVKQTLADVEKAKLILGWQPKIKLESWIGGNNG